MKTCEFCGKLIPPTKRRARLPRRFCSSACRNRAWRRREFATAMLEFYDARHGIEGAPAPWS